MKRRRFLKYAAGSGAALLAGRWTGHAFGAAGTGFTAPELPRSRVDTDMPPREGRIIRLREDGDLQRALDEARPGDTVVLRAGATYAGTFTLPKKAGKDWVTVTTSAEERLPSPGTRATPEDSACMPKIVTKANGRPAVRTARGAHHYRFVGVEFAAAPSVGSLNAIVQLHHSGTELADVPSHIVLDRGYLHGRPRLNTRRGLMMNSRWTAVVDSWLDECHTHGADCQAICCWNGPGPFKIVNNFLEGGSENVMFGGAKTSAPCMVPADIEIRRNHFYKHPSWAGLEYPDNWSVKNLFEIKNARRVLLEGNVLENNWTEAQTGFAFVLKSSSPQQGRPWDSTSDLTIRRNRIVNSLNGFSIARWSSAGPVADDAPPTSRILIEHNVFERFGEDSRFFDTGRGGFMFQVSGMDLTMRHNTAWPQDTLLSLPRGGVDNLVFIDNLVTPGKWGVFCDGGGVGWKGGVGSHIRGHSRMEGNTIVREGPRRARQMDPGRYPGGNRWFDSFREAGADPRAYRLLPDSPAAGTATDGSNPGADTDAVDEATRGVRAPDRLLR